jgi:hypothetical protein
MLNQKLTGNLSAPTEDEWAELVRVVRAANGATRASQSSDPRIGSGSPKSSQERFEAGVASK